MNCQSRFSAAGRFFICLVALSPALTLSPAASAAGQFGSPFVLSGANACSPQVAIDTGGNAVFAWQQATDSTDGVIQVRTRSADGTFGPIQTVSGRAAFDPQLGVDASSNAVIAWLLEPPSNPNLVHAQFRALSAGGVLGPITNISNQVPVDTEGVRLATNAGGTTTFVWHRPDSAIETRTRSAAGVLSPVKRVSLVQDVIDPEVAINARGDAVFAWVIRSGSDNLIQARRRSAAGQFGRIHQNLGTGGFPKVAIDGHGDAIIAWNGVFSGTGRTQMRTLSAADALGPQQFLSQGADTAGAVQVAMNAAGDAVLAYMEFDSAAKIERAKARARSAAGAIGPEQTLSPAGGSGTFPAAAIDVHGRSVFVWSGQDGAQARRRSATGALRPIQNLAATPGAPPARVAMNPRGDAAATWCEVETIDGQLVSTVHGAVTPVR